MSDIHYVINLLYAVLISHIQLLRLFSISYIRFERS